MIVHQSNRPQRPAGWPYCLSMLLAVCHSDASGWKSVEDLDEISDLRAEDGNVVWAEADLSTVTEDDAKLMEEDTPSPASSEACSGSSTP